MANKSQAMSESAELTAKEMEISESTIDKAEVSKISTHIIDIHEEIMKSMKNTVELGLRAGEALLSLKTQLPHGSFNTYIEEHFPFSVRTAQKYMKIASNPDKLEESGVKMISQAYTLINEDKKKEEEESTINSIGTDDAGSGIEPVLEEDIDFSDIPPAESFKGLEDDEDTLYWYWPELKELIKKMLITYKSLSIKRNSETPRNLGYLIGNIREMAMRLSKWDPNKLVNCEQCEGKGVVSVEEQHTGSLRKAKCPHCLNGKSGPFKITEY